VLLAWAGRHSQSLSAGFGELYANKLAFMIAIAILALSTLSYLFGCNGMKVVALLSVKYFSGKVLCGCQGVQGHGDSYLCHSMRKTRAFHRRKTFKAPN